MGRSVRECHAREANICLFSFQSAKESVYYCRVENLPLLTALLLRLQALPFSAGYGLRGTALQSISNEHSRIADAELGTSNSIINYKFTAGLDWYIVLPQVVLRFTAQREYDLVLVYRIYGFMSHSHQSSEISSSVSQSRSSSAKPGTPVTVYLAVG